MELYEIRQFLAEQLPATQEDFVGVIESYIKNFISDIEKPKLLALNYYDDYLRIEKRLIETLTLEKPDIIVTGYWFGLFEGRKDGKTIYQTYISGTDKKIDKESADWASGPKYFPDYRYLDSGVLEEIPQIIPGSSFGSSEFFFPVIYLSTIIAAFCHRHWELLLNANESIIATGWDGGDHLVLGSISNTGFEAEEFKIKKPKPLLITPTDHEFYGITAEFETGWFLRRSNKNHSSEATSQKAPKLSGDVYDAEINLERHPMDFTTTGDGLIISQKLLRVLLKHVNENEIEYSPVTIINFSEEEFYKLEISPINDCLDHEKTTWFGRKIRAKNIVFDRSRIQHPRIFLLAEKKIHMLFYVSADLKKALEESLITGMTLSAIETSF
ncbi:MAG TPA: hypothetical protein DCE41_08015 [Cytophagales bacterium]|nr:hypothetical protein [Cytophagales bacterium]HAA24141.1 hypothetical protein [Cytophagales bacterium]HAP63475.1 hypothetical protein [Cytophagales bacterium]